MLITTRAAEIATTAHAGVFRTCGQPYIAHPAWVAGWLNHNGYSADIQAVAWLHDVVEDTDLALTDLLRLGIPNRLVDAVDALTRRPDEDYYEAVQRAAHHPIGRIVKVADNIHNTLPEQMTCFAPSVRNRKMTKYAQARAILTAA